MYKLIIVCFSLLILGSCNKKNDELPPITQTGAHTFGAKVNGEIWIPRGFGPFPANDILEARLSGDDLTIIGRDFSSSPTETEFLIYIKGVTAPGVFQLNANINHPSGVASYGYYVKRRFSPLNEWVTSSSYTGTVTITRFDLVNRIVSGTFSFNLINLYNTPEPLTVTEGRFDVIII